MGAKELKYSEALSQLEKVLYEIENDELNVDEILDKVKHASELVEFCKKRLSVLEEEVEKVISGIES